MRLLDANVLIALVVAEHEHHVPASVWIASVDRFALCAVVEGALLRYLLRVGESARAAAEVLRAVHDVPQCDFWSAAPSYVETDLSGVLGHRQVTDAYLVGLARSRGARLATFDTGLARAAPDDVELLVGRVR